MSRLHRIVALLLFLTAWIAAAQGNPHIEVRVGDSYVALISPWKFAPGDSPRVEGKLSWANPGFDDSGWSDMDLRGTGEIDPAYGVTSYLKGWSARGFPRLVGYAWYRTRLHVANPGQPLALKMPDHVDDAYQLFANGSYLGEFGRFSDNGVTCYRSRAMTFKLPPPDAHGDIEIAVRFFMEPFVLVSGTTGDSGGMHEAPLVGLPSEMESIRGHEHVGRLLSVVVSTVVALAMLVTATGAFWIWLIDRPRRTFLWLTLGLVLIAGESILLDIALFTRWITQGDWQTGAELFGAIGMVCWIYFWREWFELQRTRVLTVLPSLIVLLLGFVGMGVRFSTHIPLSLVMFSVEARAVGKIALGVLLFVVLAQGARKDRLGAMAALPPILLLTFGQFTQELISWAHVRTSVFPYGIQFTAKDVALALLVLVTGALALRRFVRSQVSQRLERQTIDQEMEQARELQQHVLIPEVNTSSRFVVETAYHPARTVGGDFYQVIPGADGSLLVVVGDVSGKGMGAAMLVAVLVGALRTKADETFSPVEILMKLNERLIGRAGSHFATCIAAHLQPDGTMLVANAGHLPPYRNGSALELPGALPLGIVRGAEYAVSKFTLAEADTLTFLTDGVLEARDAEGRLLGFDAMEQLSAKSPEVIAQAAIEHGQDDDITVVGVRICETTHHAENARQLEPLPV